MKADKIIAEYQAGELTPKEAAKALRGKTTATPPAKLPDTTEDAVYDRSGGMAQAARAMATGKLDREKYLDLLAVER